MLRKIFKLSTASLLLCTAITGFAAKTKVVDYKDTGYMPVQPALAVNQVFIGYSFTHHYYGSTWLSSYRATYDNSPPNNFSGIDIGIDHMVNNWLALHFKYTHYFRKGSSGTDARISGVTIGGLGFWDVAPNTWVLGMIGATIGAMSHNGDKVVPGDATSINPAFTDADVSFALGLGLQYQFNDRFSIRPMINTLPVQDRADTTASLGFSIDLVYNLC